jgi:beta-galactosidase
MAKKTVPAKRAAASPRRTERFDLDWRFQRGDAPGAEAADLDDAGWRAIDLPHDWSVEDLPALAPATPSATMTAQRSGPFDSGAEGGGAQGFTVGGVGWYRKHFSLPKSRRGQRFTLTFDGVYMNATVWCNGVRVGEHPYGYTGFHLDLTPHLRFGDELNLIAVKVDASGKSSRWFPGAGIYRHVWLTVTGTTRVAPWGVFVTTPEVTAERARVRVQTTLDGIASADGTVELETAVINAAGQTLATTVSPCPAAAGRQTVEQELAIATPALWSPASPVLHRLVSTLRLAGQPVDRVETSFGIRRIEIDAASGFRLNGQPLKLRGGCVHHDNGCLGACTYDRAEERRVELLKAAGFNAIRTSHNPPSPAFLDACDRLGVLVMDEAFDCWSQGKSPLDYGRFFASWWERDIEAMVCRDRNHPSVVMWSIGNEIPEQATAEGAERGRWLSAWVRALDPSRAVAIGAHPGTKPWTDLDAQFAHLDVCGYNYREDCYRPDHERLPGRVIAGTESFPLKSFECWMAALDLPYVIGDFVWTALDYLGESALGFTHFEGEPSLYATWPWTVSNCGDLDLCCWRRPQAYYRAALWGLEPTVSCFVQPPLPPGKTKELVWGWGWPDERESWTWPGQEGRPLTVRVYSSCPQVRLRLNGRDLGVRVTTRDTRFTATYEVPYEPGVLQAVGLDSAGQELASWRLDTAGAPAALRLTPDRTQLAADGQDLCFVTVEVLDAAGVLCPGAENRVRFRLEGPGTIVAVGSPDPRSTASFQQPERPAYRGRCLVVLKTGVRAGKLTLTAETAGLLPAAVTVRSSR